MFLRKIILVRGKGLIGENSKPIRKEPISDIITNNDDDLNLNFPLIKLRNLIRKVRSSRNFNKFEKQVG